MFILMFTRLTGQSEAIFLLGTYESVEEARSAMLLEYESRLTDGGWDPDWSYIYENDAFCGTGDLYDTIRLYIFDTERPVGFYRDRTTDFDDEGDW